MTPLILFHRSLVFLIPRACKTVKSLTTTNLIKILISIVFIIITTSAINSQLIILTKIAKDCQKLIIKTTVKDIQLL